MCTHDADNLQDRNECSKQKKRMKRERELPGVYCMFFDEREREGGGGGRDRGRERIQNGQGEANDSPCSTLAKCCFNSSIAIWFTT